MLAAFFVLQWKPTNNQDVLSVNTEFVIIVPHTDGSADNQHGNAHNCNFFFLCRNETKMQAINSAIVNSWRD